MLFFKQTSDKDRSGESGLSLVELAIALMIIGLITIPMIKAYDIEKMKRYKNISTSNFDKIEVALKKYYEQNDALPCPAVPTRSKNQAGYGEADTTAGCGALVGNANVAEGAVPFVTLNLPLETSLDGSGNKLLYAVTRIQTDPGTFVAGGGLITARHRTWNAGAWDETGTMNNAYYVIISHGNNGVGAYTEDGALTAACPATPVIENENCNGDNVFWQDNERRSLAVGNEYFDDWTRAANGFGTDLWNLSDDGTDDNIYSTKDRIGINNFSPQYNLDVVGQMGATDDIQVEQMCDPNDPADLADDVCFDIDIVAGSGMSCPTGMVASGIGGNAVGELDCGFAPYPITNNCNATYAIGIKKNGTLICK